MNEQFSLIIFFTRDIFANYHGLLLLVRENPSDLVSREYPVNNANKEMTAGYLMIFYKNICITCTSEIKAMATRHTKRIKNSRRGDTAKRKWKPLSDIIQPRNSEELHQLIKPLRCRMNSAVVRYNK